MAFSEIYVDPSIAADSGTGTSGDPFGDLEYAIEQTTFDTTNGTRVNIKSGVNEVLAAELSTACADTVTTPAWAGALGKPIRFEGYDVTAGDGGIGGISGGGLVSIWNNNGAIGNYLDFVNLHLHNVGANPVIDANDYCFFYRCHVEGATGTGGHGLSADTGMHVEQCYVHDVGGYGVISTAPTVLNSYIEDFGSGTGQYAISGSSGGISENNILIIPVGDRGISLNNNVVVRFNAIYSLDGGTGVGIWGTSPRVTQVITNNLIQGFNGAGGYGIYVDDVTSHVNIIAGNKIYDCTTAISLVTPVVGHDEGNETLLTSPFVDAANGDFSPIAALKDVALPQIIGGGFV